MIGGIKNFRFWCQKVLPLVYDNSLSYYEILCKVVNYLNHVIDDMNQIPDYIDEKVREAFDDEHLKELISEVFRTIEDAISADNEGTNTNFSKDYHTLGTLVWHDNKLYKTIRSIDAGDLVIVDTNIELVSFADMFTSFIDEVKKNFTPYDDGLRETASENRTVNTLVWLNDTLYEVTKPITEGNAYVYSGENANVQEISLDGIYNYLLEQIADEKGAREDADVAISGDLADEILAREQAVGTLTDDLAAEVLARSNADDALSNKIGTLSELATTNKSNLVVAVNEVKSNVGNLPALTTTNKTDAVAAINEVKSNVGNLSALTTTNKTDTVAAINEVRALIANHHYLLVSDSYGDPTAVSGSRTWLDFFGDIVGSSNITKAYAGGYGFNPSGYTAPFINLITPGSVNTGVPSGYDTNKVTDIIVLGGFNDRAQTVANIKSAINTFCTYARSTYANLRNIYIGGCGWSMNAEHLATLSKGRYIKAYSECGDYGAIYLSGMEYVLHGFSLYTPEDNPSLQLGKQYVHPNAVGSQRLAQSTYNAMKNGYATCHMPWSTFTIALKAGITVGGNTSINVAEYQHDATVCLNMAINTFAGSFSIGTSKTVIPLGTITSGYYNANDFTMIPCTGWVAGNGYPNNTPMDMYLQIAGGELQVVLAGNLTEATTKTATYIVINPVNCFINVLAS